MASTDEGRNGAYVQRTARSSDFNYKTGEDKLASLDLDCLGPKSKPFSTAVEDELGKRVEGDTSPDRRRSKLLRLGALVNLDSCLSVSLGSAFPVNSADLIRLAVPVPFSVRSNGGGQLYMVPTAFMSDR